MTSPVFLLTPPPRVVTARMVPVRVSAFQARLDQGVAGTLDLRLRNGSGASAAASMRARLLRSEVAALLGAAYSCGETLAHIWRISGVSFCQLDRPDDRC
jgi:hypothetical protein